MIHKELRYTEASRYVLTLKKCVSPNKWDNVCREIQALSDLFQNNKEYVRWASRSPERWNQIIQLCQSPELIKLLHLLQKSQNITFITDIAYELSEDYAHVIVEHADKNEPKDSSVFYKLAESLWGVKSLRFVENKDLIKGAKLQYGNKTYNMSFKHYCHNLISALRLG